MSVSRTADSCARLASSSSSIRVPAVVSRFVVAQSREVGAAQVFGVFFGPAAQVGGDVAQHVEQFVVFRPRAFAEHFLDVDVDRQFDPGADHPVDRPFVAGVFVVGAEFVGARFGFRAGEDEAAVVGGVGFLLDRFGQRFDLRGDPFAGDLAVGVVAALDQEFARPLQRFGDVAERRFRRGHPTGAVVDIRLVLFEAFELAGQLQRATGPERVVGRFRDPFRRGDFGLQRRQPGARVTEVREDAPRGHPLGHPHRHQRPTLPVRLIRTLSASSSVVIARAEAS
jgi:hypothetical protein